MAKPVINPTPLDINAALPILLRSKNPTQPLSPENPLLATYPIESSGFAPRIFRGKKEFHDGEDSFISYRYLQVIPIAPGTVIKTKNSRGGFGKHVMIDHKNGLKTLYGHLDRIDVKKGDSVTPNTALGQMGNTGNSNSDHVHVGVKYKGKWVNPNPILGAVGYQSGTASSTITPNELRTVPLKTKNGKVVAYLKVKYIPPSIQIEVKDTPESKIQEAVQKLKPEIERTYFEGYDQSVNAT